MGCKLESSPLGVAACEPAVFLGFALEKASMIPPDPPRFRGAAFLAGPDLEGADLAGAEEDAFSLAGAGDDARDSSLIIATGAAAGFKTGFGSCLTGAAEDTAPDLRGSRIRTCGLVIVPNSLLSVETSLVGVFSVC
jgi:hypothetical protein